MKKIKVMHVYNSLFDGGIEKYMLMLFDGLDQEKFSCSVCCLIEPGTHAPFFEARGYKVFTLQATNRQSPLGILKNLREVWRLAALLRSEQIDIMHAHDFFSPLLARLAAMLARTPVIFVTLHNLQSWLSPVHHAINRWLSHRTRNVICVSHAVAQFSRTHDRLNDEKYIVIPNGIDIAAYTISRSMRTQYRREFQIADGDILIGNIATFSFRKGHAYLIEAFIALCKLHPNLKLMLIGSTRPQEPLVKPDLQQQLERAGLSDKVIFTGSRADAALMINAFDLFVMSSVTEGLSFASLEGMLMQKPVVYSDIAPFAEIVKHNETGFLFKSGDADDLAAQIEYVLAHPERAAEVAANARASVIEHYNFATMMRAYNRLYTEAAQAAVGQ
ncbi:MAG: glycosyltransferase [Rhizobacter sp.]|nr:glycosyltransferase [Chlorobiales bacterium]